MSDIILMHIGDCGEELLENVLDACLRHTLDGLLLRFLDDVVETFAFTKLHDEMHMCAAVDDLVQADNILMLDHGENVNFTVQRFG